MCGASRPGSGVLCTLRAMEGHGRVSGNKERKTTKSDLPLNDVALATVQGLWCEDGSTSGAFPGSRPEASGP